MHGDNPARRTVLATVGTLCSGALAGCSGSDTTGTEGGDNEETRDSQESNSESNTSTNENKESDTQQSKQELPSKDPQSRAEERLVSAVNKSRKDRYGFKFDDLEYINEEGLQSSAENDWTTFENALNDALEKARQGDEPYTIWAGFDESGDTSFYTNLEEHKAIPLEITFIGASKKIWRAGSDPDSELVESEYTEFIEERLDGEGVSNHVGEVPEYAQEALESGWQAQ